MKNNIYLLAFTLIVLTNLVFLNSCSSYKKLPYFDNLEDSVKTYMEAYEIQIKPNDILSITVNSTVPGAAVDFNLPVVPMNYDKAIQTSTVTTTSSGGSIQNYLVDKEGMIDFPVLGKLKIGDKTIRQAQDYITELISPRYISEKPVVSVRLLNFKVSVLGEVNRPGVFESENGQMTILDALAAAGDMTIYGKRDNVLLVRITSTGEISTHRINMQDKEVIANKDIFYLQQNDKLYVETNKTKGNNSSFGTVQTIGLSAVSVLISIVAILTR